MAIFHYTVSVEMTISQRDLELLERACETHYNARTRSLSWIGGFLYGWKNQLGEDNEMNIFVDSTELDSMMKALEPSILTLRDDPKLFDEYVELNRKIRQRFQQIQDEYKRINPHLRTSK